VTAPLLEIEGLCTHFHTDDGVVKAVDGVSLSLQPGELLGIVGESGSGKSVLSLSVLGLVPQPPGSHPAGTIRFRGESILGNEQRLRSLRGDRMAMIFQDPMSALNPYLSVERQLTEVLEVHRDMSRAQALTRCIQVLERVGIPDAARRIHDYPHQFSGGMRQRVVIAMALLCEPELLLADEPTTALDVTIQAQILELIRELQRESGSGVLFITHDLGVLAGIADRVVVMYAGRIVEAGPTGALFAEPRHPYTRGLLRSIPRLDTPADQPLSAIAGAPPDLSRLPPGCPFAPRCERVQARCRSEYPPLYPLRRGGHAACWDVDPELVAP
jgi:oligopeptide transport system ATP-binding protein